jgi:DNA-binding NtrC family response regulator
MLSVLIASRDEMSRESIVNYLIRYNYDTRAVHDIKEAPGVLNQKFYNVLIYDVPESTADWVANLEELIYRFSDLRVILVFEKSNVETAVMGLKHGAEEILTKPLELRRIHQILENIEKSRQEAEIQPAKYPVKLRETLTLEQIAGKSEKMAAIIDSIRKFAQTDSHVLITGPSGTGKGALARAIHNESPRKGKPFIELNCSAIPEYLFESEFFGHERGAFTDAVRLSKGLIEHADKGTIFLDEIADMPFILQAKLLSVLETKKFYRIGGVNEIKVDVRVIAATNHDVSQSVKAGTLRQDLYYRLARAEIKLPSLTERPEDIIPLAEYFIRKFNKTLGKNISSISDEVIEAFMKYSWQGNIRELSNIIERMMITSSTDILTGYELPQELGGRKFLKVEPVKMIPLRQVEKMHILSIMDSVNGDKNRAAEILGIGRSTLFDKLRQIQEEEKEDSENPEEKSK